MSNATNSRVTTVGGRLFPWMVLKTDQGFTNTKTGNTIFGGTKGQAEVYLDTQVYEINTMLPDSMFNAYEELPFRSYETVFVLKNTVDVVNEGFRHLATVFCNTQEKEVFLEAIKEKYKKLLGDKKGYEVLSEGKTYRIFLEEEVKKLLSTWDWPEEYKNLLIGMILYEVGHYLNHGV